MGTLTQEDLDREKTECRNEFMTRTDYYKSILAGIVTAIMIIGGGIAWAANVKADTSVIKSEIVQHERRITSIEQRLDKYHADQMSVLKNIQESINAR